MLRELTVHENLMHSALARLPKTMSLTEKQAVVAAVIDVLGLGDCVNSKIGDEETRGISGTVHLEVCVCVRLLLGGINGAACDLRTLRYQVGSGSV